MTSTTHTPPPPGSAFRPLTGLCVTCLRGTDTALAFQGEPEWLASGLVSLGLPIWQAVAMVQTFLDVRGQVTMPVRVCASCVAEHAPTLPEPVLCLPGFEVPCISQPVDRRSAS